MNQPSSTRVLTYLFFNGQCEQAMAFYCDKLDATINFSMRFDQSPEAMPSGVLQEGFEQKIMHAELQIGATAIFASDGIDDKTTMGGYSLALRTDSETDAKRYFSALAEGGKIDMPLAPTFWASLYGMVTDQFGIAWMVTVPGE
ncbi:VOC family protein [Gilvimarinus sp. SDUM040013]|uniref:VOC family protein n=1 Tax=Gilvimarinus gilvus TaxID=3058038 RepID=A0ABU4RXU4_9GAMM|nr:VOC family protein [Gilvimarinus sp. SDUM040013]MDO3388229.1 VOC family protein [Gilvimarinus sp. SDUM040013]MDX6847779.1 VOC family protein [Gilvimarinus sp. SDUM040013]